MTLLAVERIKLFSTRSPWWCAVLVLAFGVGLAALLTVFAGEDFPISVAVSQSGLFFGQYVVLVMATLAVTSEYRFGTIRATFAAIPNRVAVLGAKAAFLAGFAALLGLVTAFAAWGVSHLIDATPATVIDTGAEWRAVAGNALLFACFALVAVAVGALVRQTAGAVSVLLVWALVIETIIAPILDATLGTGIVRWLPFANAGNFITAGDATASGAASGFAVAYPFGPWGSLAYFAAVSVVLLAASLVVVQRRDA